MAQWFNVSSATTKGKGLQGHFDIDGGEGWFKHCLLYTSPSPRDRQKSRMPSSA